MKKKKHWLRIATKKACFAIIVKNNIVIDAAPIARKSIGRNIDEVLRYYKNRFNAKLTIL